MKFTLLSCLILVAAATDVDLLAPRAKAVCGRKPVSANGCAQKLGKDGCPCVTRQGVAGVCSQRLCKTSTPPPTCPEGQPCTTAAGKAGTCTGGQCVATPPPPTCTEGQTCTTPGGRTDGTCTNGQCVAPRAGCSPGFHIYQTPCCPTESCFETVCGQKASGSAFGSPPGASIDDCTAQCAQNPSCNSVNYDSVTGLCNFFGDFTPANSVNPDDDYSAITSGGNCDSG